jgi:ABC-type sugar transport system permease subunit
LIFLAGFMNIPSEVIDAAIVDGATGFKRLWYIELPEIRDQIKMFVLLTIIGTLQDFTLPCWLTGGGPGYETTVPALNMWQAAFGVGMGERGGRGYSYGYASTVGVVLFIAILILTMIGRRYLRENEGDVAHGAI